MAARIGVVGTGWWCTRAHLPAIETHPDAELTAIADPNEVNRSRAAERFSPASVYSDFREMLDNETLDAAVVATQHAYHYEVAAECLKRGLHVLVEKPMVLSTEHARDLLRLAAEADREIIVGYPWNYTAQTNAAREWIREGEIGELLYIHSLFASVVWELYRGEVNVVADVMGYPVNPTGKSTYSDPAIAGGGQGVTQITHSAAHLLHVTGLVPTQVFAMMANHGLDLDLVDAMSVRFEGGCLGTIGSTGSTVRTQPEILESRIYGSRGHILFDVMNEQLSMHRSDGSVLTHPPASGAASEFFFSSSYPEDAPLRNLVDIVTKGEVSRSGGILGARVVALLEAAYRSAETQLPEQVPEIKT